MRKFGSIWIGVAFTAVVNLGCLERSSTLAPSEDVGEGAGTSESPIIDGYIDEGHPSVGLVSPSGCSATLIGRRTALTAAHCVAFSGQRNRFCTDVRCMDGTAFRHPGFQDGDFDDSDVAVVRLDGDFYATFGVIPTRLSWSPPAENEWVVIVGFGCTVWDTSIGYGTKRFGYAQIIDVDDTNIQWDFQSRICGGDSGGPTFRYPTDCQVGVHSHRQDFVHGGDDADMRVDVYQGWIRGVAADNSLLACGETICGDGICHPGEVGCDCAPAPPPGGGMQADSAVRGCSNWSWWDPVHKPDAASCSSYCVQNGANACEWYAGNGDCYVEFASGGCHVASGFPGWHSAVY
jgi:hypothetical protein